MKSDAKTAVRTVGFVGCGLAAASAYAVSPRAYVSVNGNDLNTCNIPTTPCRTYTRSDQPDDDSPGVAIDDHSQWHRPSGRRRRCGGGESRQQRHLGNTLNTVGTITTRFSSSEPGCYPALEVSAG